MTISLPNPEKDVEQGSCAVVVLETQNFRLSVCGSERTFETPEAFCWVRKVNVFLIVIVFNNDSKHVIRN